MAFGTRAAIILVSLLSVGSLHGYLGIFEPTARRFIAALLLAAIPAFFLKPRSMTPRSWAALAGAAFALLMLLHTGRSLFIVPVALSLMAMAGIRPSLLIQVAGAWLCFDAIELIRLETIWARIWIDLAVGISRIVPGPAVLGPTPMALGIALLAGLLLATAALKRRNALDIGLAAVFVLAALVGQALLQQPYVFSLALSLGLAAFVREDDSSMRVDRWAIPAGAAAAIGIVMLLAPAGEPRPGKVLLYKPGLFNPEKPRPGVPLKDVEGPMVPCLFDMLDSFGFEHEFLDSEVRAEKLAEAQVVIFINTSRAFKAEEIDRLYDFMSRGGSVLAIGEHTNVSGVMDHFNPLTSRAGIQLNFDTTWPFDQPYIWGFYLDWVRHPILRGVRGEDDIQAGVGCSLELSGSARPILIGRAGYGDLGDPNNTGYALIGNKRLDRNERAGDLVLGAEAPVGEGKLVVYGDSLSFQDSYVPRTWSYMLSLFHHLCRTRDAAPLKAWGLALLLLSALALHRSALVSGAASFVCLAVVDGLDSPPKFELKPKMPVAMIDGSHRPLALRPQADAPDSTDGLVYNLYRNGLLPLFVQDLQDSRLFASKMLIVPPGARRWSDAEVELLDRYVQGGRTAIVSVGFPDRYALEPLLQHRGMSLIDTPLGNGGPDRKTFKPDLKIKFYSAWPIRHSNDKFQNVAVSKSYRLAAAAPEGKGVFMLIGDSHFFALKNLEGYGGSVEDNVEFLRYLCNAVKNQ